jgi:hypothetical protein
LGIEYEYEYEWVSVWWEVYVAVVTMARRSVRAYERKNKWMNYTRARRAPEPRQGAVRIDSKETHRAAGRRKKEEGIRKGKACAPRRVRMPDRKEGRKVINRNRRDTVRVRGQATVSAEYTVHRPSHVAHQRPKSEGEVVMRQRPQGREEKTRRRWNGDGNGNRIE